MDEESFTHRWTVKTFRNIWESLEQEGELHSADFQGLTTNHTWHVELIKHTEENVEYLGVFLCLTSTELQHEDGDKLMAKATITILDEKYQSLHQQDFCMHNFLIDSGDTWGEEKFLEAEDLLDAATGFVVDDQFRIDCLVTVLKPVKLYSSASNEIKTTHSIRSVSQDIGKLLESADFHDVIINCGTQEFKAHKAILCARSSVFSAMFKTEMTESVDRKITITDFPDHIIKEMLQFVYCGKMETKNENMLELLKIGLKQLYYRFN